MISDSRKPPRLEENCNRSYTMGCSKSAQRFRAMALMPFHIKGVPVFLQVLNFLG